MKNILIKYVVGLCIIAVIFTSGKNMITKFLTQGVFKQVTGLNLKIQSLNLGLLSTLIDIRGIKLLNPKGFEDPLMVNMPEAYVDMDLGSIFGGKIHLQEVRLNIEELMIIKNRDGKINIHYLQSSGLSKPSSESDSRDKKKPLPKMQIDRLSLKMGKVIYKDYSTGDTVKVQEYKVNLDETHENIKNPSALVGLIVAKALMNTTIAKIADIDMNELLSKFDFSQMNMKDLGLDRFESLARSGAETVKQTTAAALEKVTDFFK
jgi:uncharacterized protein involved in outer membrane biogenesis